MNFTTVSAIHTQEWKAFLRTNFKEAQKNPGLNSSVTLYTVLPSLIENPLYSTAFGIQFLKILIQYTEKLCTGWDVLKALRYMKEDSFVDDWIHYMEFSSISSHCHIGSR